MTIPAISNAVDFIKKADAVIITAGAGMGVDSGLPDFRGDEGFWKAYPPLKDLGLSFVEMANPKWFSVNPALAWGFYGHRLGLYRETTPHKGFEMLLDIVKSKNYNYFIYTSNVDGQFQKAGFDEKRILEVHGSIHHLQCSKPCSDAIWTAKDYFPKVDPKSFLAKEPFPVCPKCGAIARPNIVMFGDWTYVNSRTNLQDADLEKFSIGIESKKQKVVVIELGAGKAIPTVRLFSASVADSSGWLVRINPRDTEVRESSQNQIGLAYGALEGISLILKELFA